MDLIDPCSADLPLHVQKISSWISNHVPASDERLPRSIRADWTGRQVWKESHEAHILTARDERLADPRYSNEQPIAAYNTVLAAMWNELSPEEQEEYAAEAAALMEEGPTDDTVRAR